MSEVQEQERDLIEASYYNEAELERYSVIQTLVELADFLQDSSNEINNGLGLQFTKMAEQLFTTLPAINGAVDFGVNLTNVSVKEEELDDIIGQFFDE